jgi:hypothetical protein
MRILLSLVCLFAVSAFSEESLKSLPIGDGRISGKPAAGHVFACKTRFGGGGAHASGDWINGDGTYNFLKKPTVDGEVV